MSAYGELFPKRHNSAQLPQLAPVMLQLLQYKIPINRLKDYTCLHGIFSLFISNATKSTAFDHKKKQLLNKLPGSSLSYRKNRMECIRYVGKVRSGSYNSP